MARAKKISSESTKGSTIDSKKTSAESSGRPTPPPPGIIEIYKTGDLVLVVSDGSDDAAQISYRVDSALLRKSSRYFSRLLDPDGFLEGRAFREAIERLNRTPSALPAHLLPHIELHEVALASPGCGLGNVLSDFFRILHGAINGKAELNGKLQLGMSYLANMAVLADMFDSLPAVEAYIKASPDLLKTIDAKAKRNQPSDGSEERLRQKVFVGWLFNYLPWFTGASARLIIEGSSQWSATEAPKSSDKHGVWWDLPGGLEEELRCRRDCILNTLNSLQLHLIKIYTFRERQCTMFYDNSAQCDSFQLGEAIRFFTRVGTLRLQGLIYGLDDDEDEGIDRTRPALTGDIEQVISVLRQMPAYQVDHNHMHCGIRTRLTPALDYIQELLRIEAGLCRSCWAKDKASYAWSLRRGSGEGEHTFPAPPPPSITSVGISLPAIERNNVAGSFRSFAGLATQNLQTNISKKAKEEEVRTRCDNCRSHRLAWGLFAAAKADWTPQIWKENLQIR